MSDKNTNLLFVGGVFPKEYEATIIQNSNNNVQLAANNFQWNLINGFDDYLNRPVTILNEMFIGSYPKNYNKAFISSFIFSHTKDAIDYNLGFINIAYLKVLLPPLGEKRKIREWITETKGDKGVFIYSLNIKMKRVAKYIKKLDPSIPIIVSAMDLPEHIMKSREKSILVKIWKKYLAKTVYSSFRYIDGCMLVSNKQLEAIPKEKSDCVTIEAIVPSKNITFQQLTCKKKKIVYAGTLARQYNILDLVDAFKQIKDENAELIICGEGETKDEILAEAFNDPRIFYKGVLTKTEVKTLMLDAWALVNPRKSGQDFTAYSFPSKTMDYLLSGRPVICQKLEAIPSEYDEHIIYFDDKEYTLEKCLEEVLSYSLEKVNTIGKANFDFVTQKKSSAIQIEKIISLFDKKRGT